MAGGKVINNRVESKLDVSRSIGDVYFKPSYHTPKKSFRASKPPLPQSDVVIAIPEVKTYPLSTSSFLSTAS